MAALLSCVGLINKNLYKAELGIVGIDNYTTIQMEFSADSTSVLLRIPVLNRR